MGEPTSQPSADRPMVETTVGRIGRPHGLRGDVFVDVRTDDPERRFHAGAVFATARGPLALRSIRWHGARMVASFAEVADREAAERLRGLELRVDVPAGERPADPEEFYDHQLRGLAAHTADGVLVGRVTDVLHLPAQDTLVVDSNGREVLVPFVAEIVTDVDLAAGRVEIADRPGLFADLPDVAQPTDDPAG